MLPATMVQSNTRCCTQGVLFENFTNDKMQPLADNEQGWITFNIPAGRESSVEEQSASAPPTGGYDPDLFVDKDKIGEYICQICHEIARDCVEVSCGNGHIFCNDCIRYHFEINGRSCPADRSRNIKLAPNDFVRRKILSSDVHCKYNKFGCQWIGALRQWRHHWESCTYAPIKVERFFVSLYSIASHVLSPIQCQYCQMEVSSKLLDEHMEHCEEFLVACPWCNTMFCRKLLSEHMTSCYCKPKRCPNGCSIELPGNTLKDHLDHHCPERLVDCPMNRYGCSVQLKWKEISQHLESQKLEHLESQMEWVIQQNVQKTQQITALQSRVVQVWLIHSLHFIYVLYPLISTSDICIGKTVGSTRSDPSGRQFS